MTTTTASTRYLVFSTAGKLIFNSTSTAADDDDDEAESQASTHVGVLQTMISIYADDAADRLRHITTSTATSTTSIVFLLRPPLYLTAICTTAPTSAYPHPPPALLRIHLDALHLQLTSIVSLPKLNRLFAQRPNYDLRAKMLIGTEPFLHRLIASLDNTSAPHPPASDHNDQHSTDDAQQRSSRRSTGTEGGWPWLLGALQPIRMNATLRSQLGSALQPPSRDRASVALSPPPAPAPASTASAEDASQGAVTELEESSSLLSSVGTVTASTLSLLNPATYLPSSTAPSPTIPSSSQMLPSSSTPPLSSTPPARPKDLLYVLVLFRSQLITLLRPRKHSVHAADMHLLINAARASILSRSAAERAQGGEAELESWVPVCLPRFAPGGFVWAHVSLLPKVEASVGGGKGSNSPATGTTTESNAPPASHGHLRRPAMPTSHVSTATASSLMSLSPSLTGPPPSTSTHLGEVQPSTAVSTAQAVASAMRTTLRPPHSSSSSSFVSSSPNPGRSRTASPMPSAAAAAAAAAASGEGSRSSLSRSPALTPSSSGLSVSGAAAAAAAAVEDTSLLSATTDGGDETREDGQGSRRSSIVGSEEVDDADTTLRRRVNGGADDDAAHSTLGDGEGEGDGDDTAMMDEAQEAELMASISALRPRAPQRLSSSASRRKGRQTSSGVTLTPSSSSGRLGEENEEDEANTDRAEDMRAGRALRNYEDDNDDLTLVLVSGDPEAFASLSLWRRHIIHSLSTSKILERLHNAFAPSTLSSSPSSSGPSLSSWTSSFHRSQTAGGARSGAERSGGYSADELQIPGLRHFIYKSRTATQLTAPRFEAPYARTMAASPRPTRKTGGEEEEEEEEEEEGDKTVVGPEREDGESDEGAIAWRRLVGLYGLAWDGLHAPQPPRPETFGVRSTSSSHPSSDAVPSEKGRNDEGGDDADASSVLESDTSATGPTSIGDIPQEQATTAEPNKPLLARTHLTWTSTSTASTYTFLRTEHEAVLGWLTSAFELYVCVSPWMRRRGVVGPSGVGGKVAKWVKEREEELFLLAPPVF
ncbi:hypothetical protein V8E36_007073 [Tilletia maclaganii]